MAKWQDWIEKASKYGFVGPNVAFQIDHAIAFADFLEKRHLVWGVVGDLGSGGGLPAFAIVDRFPEAKLICVESMEKRARFLEAAVEDLGWAQQISVINDRAEKLAKSSDYREVFDLVVARGFARPAIVAEVGTGFVRPGGYIVVSEPPTSSCGSRWDDARLGELGLVRIPGSGARCFNFVCLRKYSPVDRRIPRRWSAMVKNPLF
jgi:hypothetical protein